MSQLKNISSKDNLSLDNICYLISQTFEPDDLGNQIAVEVETMCYCAELPIASGEFFNAGQTGIKSQFILLVDTESYGQQTEVKYNGVVKPYHIYRTYPRSDGMSELYCEVKGG